MKQFLLTLIFLLFLSPAWAVEIDFSSGSDAATTAVLADDGKCIDECNCKKCMDARKPDPNFQISDPDLHTDDEKAAHLIWWQQNQRELGR